MFSTPGLSGASQPREVHDAASLVDPDATPGYRKACGHEVLLFDPLAADGRTARYNPLGHVDRADPVQVIDELQRMAAMLLPTPEGADPFWTEAARTGFIAAGALLAAVPDRGFDLGGLYGLVADGEARTRLPALAERLAEDGQPLSEPAARALEDFCAVSENTFAGVRQTLTAKLGLFLNPRVCAATAASDFDLRNFKRRPMSLYLATAPEGLSRVAPLFNLLFQQLIDLSCRQPPAAGELQVLVLLDEFARLGRAEVLAKSFSYVAGYGLRLLPVLQSPAQLRIAYGEDLAEEIIANCAIEAAFAPRDLRTARDLSERLGATTVKTRALTRPAGLSDGRRSWSETTHRRPLMLPQELAELPADEMIVVKAGVAPIRARKIVYWRERDFMARVRTPPTVPAHSLPERDRLPMDELSPFAIRHGLDSIAADADETAITAWVERMIDAAAELPAPPETTNAR